MADGIVVGVATHLIASSIGFGISYGYQTAVRLSRKRDLQWFWNPRKSKRILLYCGAAQPPIAGSPKDSGAGGYGQDALIEDALSLGELRAFLSAFYEDIDVTTQISHVDWSCPVVSIGGPLMNTLTYDIGKNDLLPIWYTGLPYKSGSPRSIGNKKEQYNPEFDGHERLCSDVGMLARIPAPKNREHFLYILCGTYSIGTIGAVRFLKSERHVANLRRAVSSESFQSVIRVQVSGDNITDIALVRTARIDS